MDDVPRILAMLPEDRLREIAANRPTAVPDVAMLEAIRRRTR
jgi:hypothetical protein